MWGNLSLALEAALLSEEAPALGGLTAGLSVLVLSDRRGAAGLAALGKTLKLKPLALIQGVSPGSAHPPWLT